MVICVHIYRYIRMYEYICTNMHMHTHCCHCWLPCYPQTRKVFWRKKFFGRWCMALWSELWNRKSRCKPQAQFIYCVSIFTTAFWVMKRTEVMCRVLWRIIELLRTMVSRGQYLSLVLFREMDASTSATSIYSPVISWEASRALLLVKRVKVARPVTCSTLLNAVTNMPGCWMTT